MQALRKHRWERPSQVRAAQFRADDLSSSHASGEAPPDGFDFGQLRHLSSSDLAFEKAVRRRPAMAHE
jgi:hypothetical protein